MHVLRIEYSVPDFAKWKEMFEADPADRKGSGVLGYEILRSADDPNRVIVNLQFGTDDQARRFLESVRKIWADMEPGSVTDPEASVAEHVEYRQL